MIKPIKQKTVVEQVMEQIKELISSGEYKPGDKLPTENELAERFAVGRSSIREAIKIFNYLGVLQSKAAKGTFLADRANISQEALSWSILLGSNEKEELIETRGAIELWSIIYLTKSRDQSVHKEAANSLQEEIDKMTHYAQLNQAEKLIDADFNFHSKIIKATGNSIFLSIYQTLKSFMVDEIEISQSDYTNLDLIPIEHQKILDAITSQDVTKASAVFNTHIENIKNRLHIQ